MGNWQSYPGSGNRQSYPGLTQDALEDYARLTYLSKGEILYLMKKFYTIDPEKLENNCYHRFNKEEIINKFPVLRNNPFQDRIFSVFSSLDDNCFSFEDLLDLCSAMSAECPAEVKAAWAFKLFDIDGDNQITAKDISEIVDRLTWSSFNRDHYIDKDAKLRIANVMITGDLICVSQPTVSRIVKRVSYLLCLKIQKFIKFPINLERTKEDFYAIACFPGIVGAIDGTHIPIQNPGGPYAEVFRNRKKIFSINTQIVCGPDLHIYDIVADRPGSVHDNRIFQASNLKRKMEQGVIDGILLGDSGYGCQKYLLTPVAQPENSSEENYNKAHIKTRNTVERTIGVWKRIFPCLSKKMATKLTTTCNVIVATAVLYNICRARGVIEDIETEVDNTQLYTARNVQQSRGENRRFTF